MCGCVCPLALKVSLSWVFLNTLVFLTPAASVDLLFVCCAIALESEDLQNQFQGGKTNFEKQLGKSMRPLLCSAIDASNTTCNLSTTNLVLCPVCLSLSKTLQHLFQFFECDMIKKLKTKHLK